MRDIETIDGELRLLSRAWRIARVLCDPMPGTALIDRLLDERAAVQNRSRDCIAGDDTLQTVGDR